MEQKFIFALIYSYFYFNPFSFCYQNKTNNALRTEIPVQLYVQNLLSKEY